VELALVETRAPNAPPRGNGGIGWTIARPGAWGRSGRLAYMPEYEYGAEKICQVLIVAHPVHQVAQPIEPDHAHGCYVGEEAISCA